MPAFEVRKDAVGNLLSSRSVPIPTSISAAAQAFLRDVLYPVHDGPQPPHEDKEAWKAQINAVNQTVEAVMAHRIREAAANVETQTIAGVTVHVATPHKIDHADRAHYRIHGGGFIYFGGTFAKCEAAMTAVNFGCVTFGLDYRMPPDHPFPAAVDDGLAVYREIIKRYKPAKIAISGGSAGGNLAAAVTLKVRDNGLPMPGAVGMMTPGTDFTRASDSFETNDGIDNVLRPSGDFLALYAPHHDRKDPYLSPLFGDYTKGFPPTFLQSGTRDLLLSDTVRMHRALRDAGIQAELNVWEAMPHGGFGGSLREPPAPEDLEVTAALVEFVDRILG
jgi:monoterpene epsilon-lactone hydrolase